jgi:Fur family peroxide stress response transcriptional regulator
MKMERGVGWYPSPRFSESERLKDPQLHKQKRLELLEVVSHERNLPVTVQRRVVLNALLDRDDHPTVDQLYEDVKERMPGVSRTTIYRALETLVDLGLARRTNHFEASARFDGNTDHHHHLVCRRCNHVADIDHPSLNKFAPPTLGNIPFQVLDFSIHIEGLCAACQKSTPKATVKKRAAKRVRLPSR